jgi:hypothetical protein
MFIFSLLELRTYQGLTNLLGSLVSLQVGCTSVCCAVYLAFLKITIKDIKAVVILTFNSLFPDTR